MEEKERIHQILDECLSWMLYDNDDIAGTLEAIHFDDPKELRKFGYETLAILIEEINGTKEARFISTWEDGIEISSPCLVNEKTKEVYDIEICDNCPENLGQLEKEEVEIDGKRYPVFQGSDITEEDDEYWYE